MQATRSSGGLAIDLESEDDTIRLGCAIAELVKPGVVIGLIGPLGAGKTRLARAIAEALGVDPGAIASPTFVLINEYDGRIPVYHFDAYRLQTPAQFEELGVAEYWTLGGLCLVEWADRVRDLLPPDCWIIEIVPTGPTTRSLRCHFPVPAQGIIGQLAARLN
jgi:tRNA threonylcarbamoyladenosine biosynthesis protein TsaE